MNLNNITLSMNNKTGSVNGVRGDVRCGRGIQARAMSSGIIHPITKKNFMDLDEACKNPSDLYNMLDTSYIALYNLLDGSANHIKSTATAIEIDQDFFTNIETHSIASNILADSSGTLIIENNENSNNVHIKLASDIAFNPEPLPGDSEDFYDKDIIDINAQKNLMNGNPMRLGYTLGWFTAIAIENQKGTLIDLSGFTLKQNFLHNLQQRFYANITLASSPFDAQGPASFPGATSPAKNVYIRGPGTIGLSAHHGIQGNGHKVDANTLNPIENVLIEGVTFENYEVAAFHLNGFKNVIIKDCYIKTHRPDIPVRATLSNANFLKPYMNMIADISADELYHFGDLGEQKYSYYHSRFKESMNAMYRSIVVSETNKWNATDPSNSYWFRLFANAAAGSKYPDAHEGNIKAIDGVAYGIVGNPRGVAVNGHHSEIPDLSSQSFYIKDTSINNVFANAIEIPGVAPPKDVDGSANYPKYTGSSSIVITHDPIGAVMSPFHSYTFYDSNANFNEELINLTPIHCSDGTFIANKENTISDLKTYLPYVKPRVDNVANLISGDPSSVHFNTLLASQLIINKNKDTLWNQYNSNKTDNFRLFDISKGTYNPAFDDFMKGSRGAGFPLDNSYGWCKPYSTKASASDRTYENSFRTPFHYLTGLSDIKQSYGILTETPFTTWEQQQLGGSVDSASWDLQRDALSNLNSKVTLGHDIMAHVSKPAIGLKLDGIDHVLVDNVDLKNICQFGRPGYDWNGKYEFGQPKATYGASEAERLKGYTGAGLRGITLSSTYDAALKDIDFYNLHSSYSAVDAIDSMWEASNNNIENVTSNAIVSGIHYYGNNPYGKLATPDLYKYNPTTQPHIVIYKFSGQAKSISYCGLKQPTNYAIANDWYNSANLLLTKKVTQPDTW